MTGISRQLVLADGRLRITHELNPLQAEIELDGVTMHCSAYELSELIGTIFSGGRWAWAKEPRMAFGFFSEQVGRSYPVSHKYSTAIGKLLRNDSIRRLVRLDLTPREGSFLEDWLRCMFMLFSPREWVKNSIQSYFYLLDSRTDWERARDLPACGLVMASGGLVLRAYSDSQLFKTDEQVTGGTLHFDWKDDLRFLIHQGLLPNEAIEVLRHELEVLATEMNNIYNVGSISVEVFP